MRADERHKLKSNQLAEFIQRLPELAGKYAKLLVSLAVLVVLVIGVAVGFSWQRARKLERAWAEFSVAQNKLLDALASGKSSDLGKAADEFGRVASEYPNTAPVTSWALYYQGHTLLMQARQRALDTARASAARDLQTRAEEALRRVVDREKYNPVATPTAWLDLAGLYADREEFSKARDALAKVKNDANADSGLRDVAAAREERLRDATRIVFVRPAPTTSGETVIPGLGTEYTIPLGSAPSDSPAAATQKDSK